MIFRAWAQHWTHWTFMDVYSHVKKFHILSTLTLHMWKTWEYFVVYAEWLQEWSLLYRIRDNKPKTKLVYTGPMILPVCLWIFVFYFRGITRNFYDVFFLVIPLTNRSANACISQCGLVQKWVGRSFDPGCQRA